MSHTALDRLQRQNGYAVGVLPARLANRIHVILSCFS
jgi:hypothetical protein